MNEWLVSFLQGRSTAYLNQTTATLILQVDVAVATDSGLYNCSLTDATSAYYASATIPVPLNVSGMWDYYFISFALVTLQRSFAYTIFLLIIAIEIIIFTRSSRSPLHRIIR